MMMMMAMGLRMLLLNKISALFSFKATSRKLLPMHRTFDGKGAG